MDSNQACMDFLKISENNVNDLILEYFESNGFAKHHIDSFDHFITVLVPLILEELGTFSANVKSGGKHFVSFYNPVFESPTIRNSDYSIYPLFPNEALQRKLTYGITVYVDISHRLIKDNNEQVFHRIYNRHPLCNIPCIIGSRFCYLSQRQPEMMCRPQLLRSATLGYFIVSGQEKVLISQETLRTNWPCCTLTEKGARCEIRSLNALRWRSSSTLLINISKNFRKGLCLQVTIPFVSAQVDIFIVFAVLGVTDAADIVRLCCSNADEEEFLMPLIEAQRLAFLKNLNLNLEENRQIIELHALRMVAHLHGTVFFMNFIKFL